MILKSFAKINLSLNVNKKLKNGLHDIESYYCLINLFDKIIIKKNNKKKDIVKFQGRFSKHINKKKNSVLNTLSILREQNIIDNYYSVKIHKNIPVFAGLGGGTSNAACLTKYFIKKGKNKIIIDILEKKIGSDFKLFLHNQGFVKSLNKINSFQQKYKLNFLLVFPNIKSSTKNVYSKVKNYTLKSKYNLGKINSKKKFTELLLASNNDLQQIVEKKYSIIKELLT
ncbi:4-(cytidine 5'-diphospho)-2-C-methyl-D-erythritol kinase, partial [Pelagibacteraceae bacterium]|nr:4-(cytidine 5'-diphospho)-2-C-methyl-D-erythritol kinase [Pelagibacteraceae bacterium]